jgi:PAS domain S-box-containing protein
LARAEAGTLRDLRMVMDELCEGGSADDFPWPLFAHDGAHVRRANPACLRWFGCVGDGELLDQPLSVLCHPDDERALIAAIGGGTLEPPPAPHIQRFRDRAGQTRLGRVLSRREATENPLTYALIEPSEHSAQTFELLRLLGAAVDHLTDIVFITEAHAIDGVGRRIVFVNRAFTESSGFAASEVLGKTPSITIGEGTDRNTLARLEAALRQPRAVREDLLKYGKNGTPYWVELQILPMFDEAGQHSHFLSIQRDITERKRMEARLLESARLASAGQLSASISNDVNNPLASVQSSLEWLADRIPELLDQLGDRAQPDVDEVLAALADARAATARVAAATSHLQLLGQPQAPQREALLLGNLVDTAISEAERQLGRPLVVTRRVDPHVLVAGDHARLSHALRLAFVNAALASGPDGSIAAELALRSSRAQLSITDSGPGIGPEQVGRLAAPFDARHLQGIGDALGLFVASRLVAEIEGEVLLAQGDTGTRVELRLPLA